MRTATRNDAAERLLLFVEDELQPQFKSSAGYRDWQEAARRFFTTTLAAERRATVERLLERLDRRRWESDMDSAWVHEVLDAEAAR